MSQSNSSSSLYPLHWISFTSNQWDIGDAVNILSDETVPEKDIYPLSPHMCPSFGFLWTYWPMNIRLFKRTVSTYVLIFAKHFHEQHTHTHTHTHTLHIISDFMSYYIICIEEKSEFEKLKDMPKIIELCKWQILGLNIGLLTPKVNFHCNPYCQ